MLAARACFVALLCLAACSHTAARKPGDEYLRAVKFEGNKSIGGSTLLDGLALHRTQKRGRAPDPYSIRVDADRIRGEYMRRGYFDVNVRSSVEHEGDGTIVIYTIDEGPRAGTRVVIGGLPDDPDLPLWKIRAKLPLADGAPFDYSVYEAAKPLLKSVVEDAGYAHVQLDSQVVVDRANRMAIVELTYTPGPKSTFGQVSISGVDDELAGAVVRRLQFEEGEPYSASAITASQRALYGLGRFSTVRVLPQKDGEDPKVPVQVDVAEAARHELRLGGGFGMDPETYEVRARIGYSVAGWPFPLDTVTLDLRPAYALIREDFETEPRLRALARLERQDLFWTYGKGSIEGGFNYLAIEAYTSYGPHARVAFETPVQSDKVRARVGWGFEYLNFRDISPAIDPQLQMQIGIDSPERNGVYEQAFVVDLRDHPIEPRYGAYAEVAVTEGTKFAGGAFSYVELVPDLRGYLPIGPLELVGRARVGRFFGNGAFPATERFFLGGANSQRGFSERRLAPSANGFVDGGIQNVPYGGTAMIDTSVEMRVPITKVRKMPLGALIFLDGGDVTNTAAELDPFNLHWSLGGGLRLQTIIGPIRFDFGYRLNRKGPGEPDPTSTFAFHLSLGEAF